ncbi:carbonic anhydrase [Reichenbachiella ulvae]|uniref:Carbonic anhydrase n=1 Tax=Reichenbachiella ulvae TaxID=2980104 RepID=A0ABT3CTT3_9BACT|nr:carbonic anhydrase family protein [Reichenbachiella ulvae]MCV9387115.1 carbonic anhydrase family protein [Reichenbachiella ulvae]
MKYFVILILIAKTVTHLSAQSDQSLFNNHSGHHDWAYSGQYGPDHWAELDPEYRDCNGDLQSPIDLVHAVCQAKKVDIQFHYHPFFVDLINNGHTLIEKVVEPKALELDGETYTLLQFHFHTPSEHHVDHKKYPMEIHFVHQNQAGDYAVIAVLVEYGIRANPFLAHFMKSLPTHVHEERRSHEKADPMEALPRNNHKFFYYKGSLTTPPCSQNVSWVVMEKPVQATEIQIAQIHNILYDDNRPIQDSHNRVVYLADY